jgi:hypothetical protein
MMARMAKKTCCTKFTASLLKIFARLMLQRDREVSEGAFISSVAAVRLEKETDAKRSEYFLNL